MTVLEFVSHLSSGTHLSIRNIDSHLDKRCTVLEIEDDENVYWQSAIVSDWFMNDFGRIFLEVEDV